MNNNIIRIYFFFYLFFKQLLENVCYLFSSKLVVNYGASAVGDRETPHFMLDLCHFTPI